MNVTAILVAALVVGGVGILIGFFLGISGEKFKVEVDEKEVAILGELPGNNCGGCGYAGCSGLAAAIAKGEAPVNQCPVGGAPVAAKIGAIMGVDAGAGEILLLDVTPLSLSIETMGGIATRLIERNTTIPTRKSQIFSTAADNQTAVDINVVQGERQFAKDNKSLGQFRLDGIPPARRGVPQIEVTFDIDANGIVNVSAKDLGTGRHQEITITASSNLSDAEIDRAIREAAEYEATDGQRKAYIDARSEADTLIRQVEVAYKEKKKTIDSGARHQIKSSLSYVKKLVSRTKPGNVSEEQAAELQRAAEELRSAAGVLGI